MTEGPQGERGEPGPLERQVKVSFVVLVVVAFAIATVQGYAINENRKLGNEAAEAHAALCSFKADLRGRAARTLMFIVDIEAGRRPPIQGISVNDLQRTLDGQRATLSSLGPLDCS